MLTRDRSGPGGVVTDLATVPASGGTPAALPGSSGLASATWLPDGTAVVAADESSVTAPLVRLGVSGAAAGTRARLSGTERGDAPAVRPGGREVAFLALADDGTTELKVAAVQGGGVRSLPVPARTYAATVAWSPDGSRLDVSLDSGEDELAGDLWSVRADGGDPRPLRVTRDAYEDGVARRLDDATAPAVTVATPPPWTLASRVSFSYGARDAGVGVASYDVATRSAAWGAGFGPSRTVTTTARTWTVAVARGTEVCVAVRARDWYGNTSAWSSQGCTAVPLDDRDLARSSGWSVGTGSGWYAGTWTATTRSSAQLGRSYAQGKRFALVAQRCPSCGRVDVFVGGRRIAAGVNLQAATSARAVVPLPVLSSPVSGPLVVRSTVAGRTVRVDGVAALRR